MGLVGLLLTLWMIFSPADYAHADETNTVQVSPSDPTITENATATIEVANTEISQAETYIEAIENNATAITSPTEAITATIAEAQDSITQAQAVVDSAAVAVTQVDSAIVLVEEAEENVEIAEVEVELQTEVVAIATTNLINAENTLAQLENTPSDSTTYTTEGYVAPVAPETPTVNTTTLPVMYDGSTKIETPFDIKMGDIVYNGQGADSQIYVTSKATITFGIGDHIWWDFPQGAHISVYGSDFMSAGEGAGITVTTTETTLAVDWDLHRFGDSNGPITNVNWTMTVNPDTGEWTGIGTVSGNTTNLYNGPRIGVRETVGQPVEQMTNVTNENLTEQIQIQEAVVEDKTEIKAIEVSILQTLTQLKIEAEEDLVEAEQNLEEAHEVLETTINQVGIAIAYMNTSVNEARSEVNNVLEQEEVARQASLAASAAAQAAQAAAAEAEAAQAAAEQAEADRIAAEEAATQAEAEAEQAEADRIAAEEAAEQAAQEAAEQEEAAAQAAAEAAEAEAEEARQAEEDAKAEAEAKEAEAEDARQAEEDAKAEVEAKEEEAEEAKAIEEELKEIAEDAKDGKELTEEQKEKVIEALLEDLKPGESISAAAIQASGVSYADLPPSTPIEVRTDENGNALVITAAVAANI